MLKQSKSRAIRARGRNDSRWRGMDVLRVSVRHVPRSSDQHTDCSLSRENACLGRSRVLSHPNSDDRFWPSVAVVCARLFGPIRLPKSPDADFLPCTVMALCRRMTVGMDVSPEPILLAIDVLPFRSDRAIFVILHEDTMSNPSSPVRRQHPRIPELDSSRLVGNLGNV